MIDLKDRLSNRLIKPWTAHGILILRKQAHCVEVEVPMLALNAEEVGRAVTANLQYIENPGYPKEALDPNVTFEQHCKISKAWRHELTVAQNDLTLAAALLARRAPWIPLQVTRSNLDFYARRHLWRGGTIPGNPNLVEFLFQIDGPSPTVYVASDELAAVTRYVGAEFLSIRVSEDELRLRVQDAVMKLEEGGSPTPRSITNMEGWLSREESEAKDNQENDDHADEEDNYADE